MQARSGYLEVLRGLAGGDTLGPPYGARRGVNKARRFIRSGEEHSDAVIQDMARHGLLEIDVQDDEERISITAAGSVLLRAGSG